MRIISAAILVAILPISASAFECGLPVSYADCIRTMQEMALRNQYLEVVKQSLPMLNKKELSDVLFQRKIEYMHERSSLIPPAVQVEMLELDACQAIVDEPANKNVPSLVKACQEGLPHKP